jgi:lipopolysaccharide biosynthesis glycosyltransferase
MAANDTIFKGTMELAVDADAQEATLSLVRDAGAEAWDENKVWNFFRQNGVVYGYVKAEILEIIAGLKESKESTWQGVVAKGDLPTPRR